MKKTIKRYWGIGLILIILASLVVTPATVTADDNEWMAQSAPSGATYNLNSGADVADIAVFGNGSTVFAVTGVGSGTWNTHPTASGDTASSRFVYKSTNGGATWAKSTSNTSALPAAPSFIAVAPDNVSRIAVATAAGAVYVSLDGGVNFYAIGVPTTATSTLAAINDLTISSTRLGANYVTVAATDNASAGKVYYYNLGAPVLQTWAELASPFGAPTNVGAVAYSPNFSNDLTMVAVTVNAANVSLQGYSFSGAGSWNPADFTGYPVVLNNSTVINKASLALAPDFLGGDDSLRNVFIGLDTTTDPNDGIYRVLNGTGVRIGTAYNIYSVAYDGTTLVAGQTGSSAVLRSLDPMASTPTVTVSTSLKSPSGAVAGLTNTTVAFVGANLIAAGTVGANSAYSLSRTSAASFNDVSFIDTALTTGDDMAVSADGKKIYWVTDNGVYVSLWLKGTSYERVLTFADTAKYIVRIAPNNPDVVYLAAVGGTRIYFSKDVQARWSARSATDGLGTFMIKDFVVESDTVAYALNTSGYIIKSVNEGFIWSDTAISTKLTSGYDLVSVKENVLLATANTGGRVAYSLDGGTTWNSIAAATETGITTPTIVIPDEGFATNNIIYAASTSLNSNVMKWVIGGTNTVWEDIYGPGTATVGATYGVYGLAMKGGVVYALAVDTTANISSLRQYIPSVRSWAAKDAAIYVHPVTGALQPVRLAVDASSPNGLYASTGPNKLWALQTTVGMSMWIGAFTDSMATTPPALGNPSDKTSVTSSTGQGDVVVLTWNRAGNATSHTVQVAYDSAFTQTLTLPTGTAAGVYAWPTLNVAIGATTVTVLSPGKTYYWRVRASAPINSTWSEVRTFTVQALAAAVPALASPTNGATILNQSPAFSWSPVTGTTKYEFQLSTTPTFGTTVLTDTPASAGTLVPVTIKLEQGKQYFWRVRALEPVTGDWSTAGNFMVAVPTTTAAAVTVTVVPAPIITIPAAPPAATYTIAPPAVNQIAPTYIWAIIIIGAILVIAVIVLIVRTRRSV
jgi:hypothetical protein